jgi:hypothetical protein
MKTQQKTASLMLGLSLTLTASLTTAGTTGPTTVKQILLYEAGDLAYIYPTAGLAAPPSCAGSNAYYSFKLNRPRAKEYLAGLMAAQVSGLKVTLNGTGGCTDQTTSETLAYYTLVKP